MSKFLLDENLSRRLVGRLSGLININHVSERGLLESLDGNIWEFSKTEGYTIITQDNDFRYMSYTFGCPPKIIKLNCGNQRVNYTTTLITDHLDVIREFELSVDLCYLEIG